MSNTHSPSSIRVYCRNINQYIDVTGSTTIGQIAEQIEAQLGFRPICAHVNNKTEGLSFAIYAPKDVEYLDASSPSGNRVYVRSLCMMLYAAASRLYPGARLCVEHSLSRGYFCRIKGISEPVNIPALESEMKRITEEDIPFVRHEERTENVIALFRSQGLNDKVLLLESSHQNYSVYHTLGSLADSYYGCLAPSTGHIGVFALTPYNDGILLRAADPADLSRVPEPVSQQKMFRAFTDYVDFNEIVGVRNVGELNMAVDNKEASSLINVAEALHEKYISRISDEITQRYNQGGARVVLVSGPSSSGKTTTTKRLSIQLMTNLLKPVMISLDDYFVNRDQTPRDASGEYDYESLYALDIEQFNKDLVDILQGKEVELPRYSFELGKRVYDGNRVRLGNRGILLIEGIHGLNPNLTPHIPEEQKFRIYVSALTTLSIDDHNWVPTTDNRLLRRMIRDYKYRGTSPLDTIRRWPSVRAGEEKWIFPFQENADAMFNSSLIFELGVMKDYGEEILSHVYTDTPEYATAYRLRKFLSYFHSIPSESVPPTSLLREFLGGSSFHY